MADSDSYRRDESEEERLDRNLLELLNELRVALPGVQVLFAFLLIVPFSQRFTTLTETQEELYYVALLATAASALLLIAPSAHHRINFRQQDKAYIVFLANKLTIAGLGFLAIAMCCVVWLITDLLYGSTATVIATSSLPSPSCVLWYVIPVVRRIRRNRSAALRKPGVPGAERQREQPERRDQHRAVHGLDDRARQHPGEEAGAERHREDRHGREHRERGGGLELCRQRGDQQQHDGAGAGEPVQRPDASAWRGVRTWR